MSTSNEATTLGSTPARTAGNQGSALSKIARSLVNNLSKTLNSGADKRLFTSGLGRFLVKSDDGDILSALITTLADYDGLSRLEGIMLADLKDRLAKYSVSKSCSDATTTSGNASSPEKMTEEISSEVVSRVDSKTEAKIPNLAPKSRGSPTTPVRNDKDNESEKFDSPKEDEKSHKKRLGAKILEKQGWSPGRGLGDSTEGITKFLKPDERYSDWSSKRGLGFPIQDGSVADTGRTSKNVAQEESAPIELHRGGFSSEATAKQLPSLSDTNFETQPITGFQKRELQFVLANMKGINVGGYLGQSLKTAWPEMWELLEEGADNPVFDITTLEAKLENDSYVDYGSFMEDVRLMVAKSETAYQSGPMAVASKFLKLEIFDKLPVIASMQDPAERRQSGHTGFGHPPTNNAPFIRIRGGAASYSSNFSVGSRPNAGGLWG